MSRPLISVITINFNNAFGLEKSIQSLANQSFTGFEFIVIDGASTDGSLEVIDSYCNIIAKCKSEQDSGIYDAINKGISLAEGEFLLFLNGGDELAGSDILEKVAEIISKDSPSDIYFGNIILELPNKGKMVKEFPQQPGPFFFQQQTLNHQAAFFRRELFTELGQYPLRYRLAADYWFFLKAYMNNKKFQSIGFPVVVYDTNGVSSLKMEEYRLEMKQVWNELVPQGFTGLMQDFLVMKQERRFTLVSASIRLNSMLQRIKKKK